MLRIKLLKIPQKTQFPHYPLDHRPRLTATAYSAAARLKGTNDMDH